MRACLGYKLLAATAAARVVQATIGASVNGKGFTEIYGNSFGKPGWNETYDYVIVGGGTSGSVIAARLALAGHSVAVLEAGSFYEITDSNRTQVPGYNYIDTLIQPTGDLGTPTWWALNTVPQSGYNNRSLYYGSGQTFGGSTASNFGGTNRASKGTFDDKWAKEVNDSFWTWDNVYPAYKKSVHFSPPDFTKINPSYNITYDPTAFSADGGPLWISFGNNQGAFGPSLGKAMEAYGLTRLKDLDAGNLLGYGTAKGMVDTRTATRSSAESSYLQYAAANSSGLKLYPNALATRILFDGKKATGVEVMSNFATTTQLKYYISATKEVIVTAGVFRTPQLLMVSGVGPADILQQHGIDVVLDSPAVGQNEFDQPAMLTEYEVSVETHTQLVDGNATVVAEAVKEYLYNQSGPLSGIGAGQGVGFEKFSLSKTHNLSAAATEWLATFPSDWPDVQFLPLECAPSIPGAAPGANYMLLIASINSPKSLGNVTISSASVLDPPVLSPNWLEDPVDVELSYAALQSLRSIGKLWDSKINLGEVSPGPTVSTKEESIEWLRNNMFKMSHATSTCKMGPDSKTSVVDSRGRVYGLTGLRIGDASAFPFCTPGLPMSAVYMFGEKIAETILAGN